jgi:Flp pilus assembly protein TadD
VALNNLGMEHEKRNRLGEAERCYRRAIDLRPDHWGAHMGMGRVLALTGRIREADAQFTLAGELRERARVKRADRD